MSAARIVARHSVVVSPWVTLVAREVAVGDAAAETYHALEVADYVSVLAITAEGRVPLVRQFRPALERMNIELPGGLAEPDEAPAVTAARELREEAGFVAPAPPRALGRLETDAGRLNNRMWGFFAAPVTRDGGGWRAEPGVEPLLWSVAELRGAVADGRFSHAPHVALIGLAVLQGLI
jgi:ADP-ribose pyrophosphatase